MKIYKSELLDAPLSYKSLMLSDSQPLLLFMKILFFFREKLHFLVIYVSDMLQNTGGHKLPNLGHSPLWKNFTVLEAHYSDNNFPDPMDIGFIARRLEVDPLHIHMWFKVRLAYFFLRK